jgi:hypothetical protein
MELNARPPYTSFPLELIRTIKGNVGNGFVTTHIKTSSKVTFSEIARRLQEKKLLITKKHTDATGVVPFNTGMMRWGSFNVAIMADSWEQAHGILQKVRKMFEG